MFDWLRRLLTRRKTKENSSQLDLYEAEHQKELLAREKGCYDTLLKQSHIAAKNQARQQSVMGHGLKSRNFKPRSAYEKRTWKLHEKPEREEDENNICSEV